jgi:hypothetical protein
MAQLRQDFSQFLARDMEAVVVGPEDAKAFAENLSDRAGVARYVHYGYNMSDIPANEELLALRDEINAAADPEPTRSPRS